MALPDTLPTAHSAGDTGHVADHNLIVTALTDVQNQTITNTTNIGTNTTSIGTANTNIGNLQTAVAALGPWSPQPSDNNLKAWVDDPLRTTASFTLTQGVLYLAKMKIPNAITVTNLWLIMTTALTTPTAGQNFVGLYDSSGNLLCTSADVGSSLSSTGVKQLTIPSTNLSANTFCFGALLTNATTAGGARGQSASSAAYNNVGLSVAASRGLTSGTSQTALPATVTLGSATQGNNVPWMGIS